jgi:hypothetical protein
LKIRKYRYFCADFETTVYEGQKFTEVWASSSVELYTEDVKIYHSIDDLFDYYISLKSNIITYFHNLKFDGSFWLPFLLQKKGFKHAVNHIDPNDPRKVEWIAQKYMQNNTFRYAISEMGQFYTIIIKVNDKFIEIRDSLKLLPFSVEKMGKSFKTKHRKLDMEYKGFRFAGCEITDKEKEYIANDVLVVKECLEIMQEQGHDKLTIGSCCLEEFKGTIHKDEWDKFFPNLYDISIDSKYGASNAGEYIKRSYRGGWCYVVKGKEAKMYYQGCTADVNSLYPSMMHSESGNRYPLGKPMFWDGNYIPDKALEDNMVYFIRIKTRFYLKKDMLPFIQIKRSFLYKGEEMLETSDIYDRFTGKYSRYYLNKNGEPQDSAQIMTLTMMDFELLKKHYELVDFEILDGCYFYSAIGIFDEYINKYKEIKMNSTGAVRELAKLFLNNLYGKLASNTDSSFKVAYVKPDGSLGFYLVYENEKEPGYIPCGSFITSYARRFTITSAQENYHGVDSDGFIYADTDSIHCSLLPEEIKGCKIDDSAFCCWKIESQWDNGYFVRAKTYIEHVIKESEKGVMTDVKPFYLIKCAGMPDRCKDIFLASMTGEKPKNFDKYEKDLQEYTLDYMKTKRTVEDFNVGKLRVRGKLRPHRIVGGIVLEDSYYEMRG